MELIIDILSIICVIILGIITSYEDIKENKIRNKWVGPAILIALVLFIARIASVKILGQGLVSGYIWEYLSNFVLSFGVGFVIWELKLWNAADSKLMLAYAALIPFTFYYWGYTDKFPSFTLFTNTFIPYLLIGTTYLIIKTDKKTIWDVIKQKVIRTLPSSLSMIIGFLWITNKFTSLLNFSGTERFNIVIVIAMMIISERYLKVKVTYLGIGLSLLAVILDFNMFDLKFFLKMLKTIFFYIMLRFFIVSLGFKFFTKRVRVADLEPGMVLADKIIESEGKYRVQERIQISISQAVLEKVKADDVIKPNPEGLSKEEIEKIKNLRKSKKLDIYSVNIAKIYPFAPFLFLGVILTLICKGSVLTRIYMLLT